MTDPQTPEPQFRADLFDVNTALARAGASHRIAFHTDAGGLSAVRVSSGSGIDAVHAEIMAAVRHVGGGKAVRTILLAFLAHLTETPERPEIEREAAVKALFWIYSQAISPLPWDLDGRDRRKELEQHYDTVHHALLAAEARGKADWTTALELIRRRLVRDGLNDCQAFWDYDAAEFLKRVDPKAEHLVSAIRASDSSGDDGPHQTDKENA